MRHAWRLVIGAALSVLAAAATASAQDYSRIWEEFVAKLKAGTLSAGDIRSEYTTPEQQLVWLKQLKDATDSQKTWEDWQTKPKIFPVEKHVQVLARFRVGTEYQTRCFTFLVEGGRWFYSHMEMIFLRLDEIGEPPISKFPDIPEETKTWMREENYWSTIIGHFYVPLSKEKGPDYALSLIKDGDGYFVTAKTWVPFLPPRRAFILWLCWEQSLLHGNLVSLERINDDEAVVKMQTHYFFLYKNTSHMKTWISFADYRRIFETIWTDRAEAAGWKVAFEYEDKECLQSILRFSKK
jgi:hypothetical protein